MAMSWNRLACCALLLVSGCASWSKPGASTAERRATLRQCEAGAEAAVPPVWENTIARSGAWIPSRTECTADGRACRNDGARFQWPEYRTRDANAGLRESVVASCMRDQGWSPTGGL
ncbi:hypothetical protein [Teichococcus vastitatis]|uniref:Lipoprotein n=1 Tax=Teichococcus vastitatis TaxID=2307076 RepID=A0ABS9WCJ6_9PROT|nr:hypothetical protein [Pseudoroseomonas vastitatis]MCI0757023.1 hypothetical protein [Pseudoroseomonas vastitatis]